MCGVVEGDFKPLLFECDHIKQLEAGGVDEFENTMMLCASCHTEKTGKWNRTKQWRKMAAKIYEDSGYNKETGEVISRGEITARKVGMQA
jgi:hypothetical protein